MTHENTTEELALFDDISSHAASLWDRSGQLEGLMTDPKMFSALLFGRLWSNHRGYVVLWKHGLQLESDIILRSGIEASICLAANFELREKFVELMHGDAIFTLKGQIRMHRDEGSLDMVRDGEAVLRDVQARFPPGSKPARLNWRGLAQDGRVPHLYAWHKMLSGHSSHVTGASILTSAAPANGSDPAAELGPLQRKMHLMMMAGATLQGSLRHAGMLNDQELTGAAVALLGRLGDLSWHWPGVSAWFYAGHETVEGPCCDVGIEHPNRYVGVMLILGTPVVFPCVCNPI